MMNQAIQRAVESQVLKAAHEVESQLDAKISAYDNLDEGDIERMRERRLEELKRLSKKREEWVARGHGELTEVDEKGFFSSVKGEERAVALFVRSSRPCEILTEHVRRLAPLHLETLFVKVDAEKAPFLADRLKLWMLPTLAVVKNGSVEHYIVGLDDFGGTADFPTARVEDRLADLGAIRPRGEGVGRTGQPGAGPPGRAPATGVRRGGFQVTSEDEDSDFD